MLDKISSKEKVGKKVKLSKEKDLKLKKIKSEKRVIKESQLTLDTEEKPEKKKKGNKKNTLDKSNNINSSNSNNKSNEINQNNFSNSLENKSSENANNVNNINNINTIKTNESNILISSENLETKKKKENSNIFIKEEIPPATKKHSLDIEKSKYLNNNVSNSIYANYNSNNNNNTNFNNNINNSILTNDAKYKSDIFNLDISNVKNTYIMDAPQRDRFDLSPDYKNIDILKQTKSNDKQIYLSNDNDKIDNINTLLAIPKDIDNIEKFSDNNNNYFDKVLDMVEQRNRDKSSKKIKNKKVKTLVNSVNAHYVNSKLYTSNKGSFVERKQSLNTNINNISTGNFNNLLVTNNSEIFFDNAIKSPIQFDDNINLNQSNINNNTNLSNNNHNYNNNLVSSKNNLPSKNEDNINLKKDKYTKDLDLHQIKEIPRKKKKVIKTKDVIKSKLESENDSAGNSNIKLNNIREKANNDIDNNYNDNDEVFINLNQSSDEEPDQSNFYFFFKIAS